MSKYKSLLAGVMACMCCINLMSNGGIFADYNEKEDILLEEDDFSTNDEYEAYLSENPGIKRQQYSEFIQSVQSSSGEV